MKLVLFVPILLALGAGVQGAEPRSRPATNAPGLTNKVIIICQAGMQVTTNHVVFRHNVQAQDSQMYLECELLTVYYRSKTTNAPKPAASGPELSTDSNDIDLIVAETNVMIITAEMQIIGDRAVYNAAEDLLFVTGQLVVALNVQGSFAGTNIVYNRRSGEIHGDGPITTIFNGGLTRSNAPPPASKPKPKPK